MQIISHHNHTGYTGHGTATVAEVVDAAVAKGMSSIAITEHYPMPQELDGNHYLSMDPANLDAYIAEVTSVAAAHDDIEVILGCEMDWFGADETRDLPSNWADPFTIILGSVHFVDGWAFDDPSVRGKWDEVGPDAIWTRYFELWCDAVTSSAPFTTMSHPDLVKKFGYQPSFDPTPLYAEAATAAADSGRLVEVNTSGLYYDCAEMFPTPSLLERFCAAGVPCTIGSDAHEPGNVDRSILDGYRYMYEAGYRNLTVIRADGDRMTIPIER